MFEISTLEQGSQKDYPKLVAGIGQGGKDSRKDTFFLELEPQPAPLSFQESLQVLPWADPQDPGKVVGLGIIHFPEVFSYLKALFKAQPGRRHPTTPPFPVPKRP